MTEPASVTLDFETRSYSDLMQVGAWVYSEDPTTDVICACWGIDSQPIQAWDYTKTFKMPRDLKEALADPTTTIEAHNVAFERAIWTNVMVPRYGWKMPQDHQWRDLMATACYYAMPAKLERLAAALRFQGKDPDGARLITKYSKLYLKTAKKDIPPEDLARWIEYCKRDVQVEQSVSDFLGDLPERELPIFQLDQKINLRGLYLDVAGIEAASKIVDQRAEELTVEFRELTGLNPGQGEKLHGWFAENGLKLDNLQATYLEELLEEGDIPQGPARRALEIRLKINKASTKKLDAMARQRSTDGRARFQQRYHGAQTGRNTGSGFQPLNLNRGFDDMDPDQLVRDIMYGDAGYLDAVYGDAMDAISKASRYWIKAAPGNKIIAGDFVSVEAVILACLAGESWKVEAFRQRKDIYCVMADKIYGLPPGTATKKTHPSERQDGKKGELAFGFGGALGAWLKFDPYPIHSDERILEICKLWRREDLMIVQLWRGLEDASIEAVEHRGRTTGYRDIGFQTVDEWLSMILPNGKRIWYFDPQIRAGMPPWHQPLTKPECAEGSCDCRPRAQLTYMAQKNGTWQRVRTYGAKVAENATQATSREVLIPATMRAEKAGYGIILTVYDEIVAEVPKNFGSVKEFEEIMKADPEPWYADWPINVDGWAGERYKK